MIFYQNYKQKIKKSVCKVLAHMEIKGDEEVDKAAKEALDMPGMTTIKLPCPGILNIKR